jgi:hypothetical protein
MRREIILQRPEAEELPVIEYDPLAGGIFASRRLRILGMWPPGKG